METFVENLLEGKVSLKTKAVVIVVLLLLLVLLLAPFVVMAAHVYNFEISVFVVKQVTPSWFWTWIVPASALAWLVLIRLEFWLNESSIVLKIVATLAIVSLAPYILIVGVAGAYAVVYGGLFAIVVICGLLAFVFSQL